MLFLYPFPVAISLCLVKEESDLRCPTRRNKYLHYAVSGMTLQRSTLFCANIVKKDPGRAKQNSLVTAHTNFTKPGAQNKGDLCT